MEISVFQFADYKEFLQAILASPDSARGSAKKLADAAGCQRSYLSSVLHGSVQLTPDHACGLCDYWNLPAEEAEYFSLLVDLARSGTPRLRQKIQRKLKALKEGHENLANRLDRQPIPIMGEGAMYYSSWFWSAAHILVAIPKYQTAHGIATKLRITEEYALSLLRSLESIGLVKHAPSRGRWTFASGSVHVPKSSPWVALHHQNWRQQAVLHAQQHLNDGVHFTTVTAMSQKAFEQINQLVLQLVDQANLIADPSPSEELVCMTLDFFKP